MAFKGDAHTDVPLSNYAQGFRNPSYIADLVCPRVGVNKETGQYYIYGTEDLKYTDTLLAQKTATKGISRSLSTANFRCNEHGLHEMVDDKDRANADEGVDPDMDAVDGINERMSLALEVEVATLLVTAANYSSASFYKNIADGGDQWNDPGYTSDPLGLIEDAKGAVFDGCLKTANAIIIPYKVALALARHPAVSERLKYTIAQTISAGIDALRTGLEMVIGLQVFIAASGKDTNREGQSGHTFVQIWGENVVIFHLNPGAGWKDFAFCKNFNRGTKYVSRIPQPDLRNNCEKIEVVDPGRDPIMVGNTGGYLITNTLQ